MFTCCYYCADEYLILLLSSIELYVCAGYVLIDMYLTIGDYLNW